jgi:solute carrier family 36 (proton-coupled amino acid transporter)
VQSVLIMIPISIALGYALQLYIPIEIIFPVLKSSSKVIAKNSKICEIIFRVFMVFVTLSVALLVPNLSLLISMIGAVCSTTLALIFPVVINYFVITKDNNSMGTCDKFKSLSVLLLALVSFLSGGYESICRIVDIYQQ